MIDLESTPSSTRLGTPNGISRRLFAATGLALGASLAGSMPGVAIAATQSDQKVGSGILSPRDFGAPMDGVNDDTEGFQRTLAAANRSGKSIAVDGKLRISSPLSLINMSGFEIDWQSSAVAYHGAAGSVMLDMTQAGIIRQRGGYFGGTGANHFVRTRGSAASQSAVVPAPTPGEDQWSRQLWFDSMYITGFSTAFSLENWSREIWVTNCHLAGNLNGIVSVGKVANLRVSGTTLYSAVTNSHAYVCRGDNGDPVRRFAEGHFFVDVIGDVKGTTYDVQDLYYWRVSGGQIKTSRGGLAIAYTAGLTSLTRDAFVSDALVQGAITVGSNLSRQTLLQFKASNVIFSNVEDTAFVVASNCKGVTLSGASFDTPTGTPRMFSVGANCAGIKLDALQADAATYTNLPTVDPSSISGLEAEFSGTWTPGLSFGGNSAGITYGVRSGRFSWRGGTISGTWELTATNIANASGEMAITGLPYPARRLDGTATIGKLVGINTPAVPILGIAKGGTVIKVARPPVAGPLGAAQAMSEKAVMGGDVSNGLVINGSFSFDVS